MKTEEGAAISVDKVTLKGNLAAPKHAQGIVLFAHGSGSSRFSPRNRNVAKVLQEGGLATLLIDLCEDCSAGGPKAAVSRFWHAAEFASVHVENQEIKKKELYAESKGGD